MLTKEKVTKAFMKDLRNLLKKYDAEIEAEDHFPGYPESGEDIRMTVTIDGLYDEDGNKLREMTEINLGDLVSARYCYPK